MIYTQWIHSISPEPTKSNITRKKIHMRTHSWRTETAFNAGIKLKVETKYFLVDTKFEISVGVNPNWLSSESVIETKEFSVMQEITISRLYSVKVESIVTDYVQVFCCFFFGSRSYVYIWLSGRASSNYGGCQSIVPTQNARCSLKFLLKQEKNLLIPFIPI